MCQQSRVVEVRIDVTSEGSKTVVCISNRLDGAGVAEFNKACGPVEGDLVLDLSHLRYADAEGTDLIRTLAKAGAEIRGASRFIQLLLGSEPREHSRRSSP